MIWDDATPLELAHGRAGLAQAVVAHVFDVKLEELRAVTRGAPRAARARQVAMYLCHVVFRMSSAEIAGAFARHKATAHHALRHVEDLRDDPALDRTLQFLEGMLRGAAGRAA